MSGKPTTTNTKKNTKEPRQLKKQPKKSGILAEKTTIRRREKLLTKYGLTLEMYSLLLQHQNGVCAICEGVEKRHGKNGKPINLSVDHKHGTQETRGLLCMKCNTAIGLMNNDVDRFKKAINR